MHDWILFSVIFDWKLGKVTMEFLGTDTKHSFLYAEGVSDLRVPHGEEWGPSIYVNELIGPEKLNDGKQKVRFEMQSGDVIEVTAQKFDFPKLGTRVDSGTLPITKEK